MPACGFCPGAGRTKCRSKRQAVEPLAQWMLRGDAFPDGFANGHTLRNSASLRRFQYTGQTKTKTGGTVEIITDLQSADGLTVRHRLSHTGGAPGVQIVTEFINGGGEPVTLDMLSSFSIGGITPFLAGDAPESLIVHRLRSKWSNEGRLESIPVEDLQLEPSWSGYGAASERFGQVGSMPVRRYFPMAAVEDTVSGVLWGAQLACPSSWQMELYRRDDGLSLSGGLADYDFGQWSKTLAPGERLTAPAAYLTVCTGDIDRLCARLVAMQEQALAALPMPKRLPVVFNEYCTTWGKPSLENVERILSVLRGRDLDYFVIDAGWYADENRGWGANMGDWEVNERLFPGGLEAAAEQIRRAGLKPGIWFEPEVCGADAAAFQAVPHLLKRHGTPVTVGQRRFWDLTDPWVIDYLNERVIGLLQRCGFQYIKIDYNDSIGTGCDHPDGLGEGLRLNQRGALALMQRIHEAVPGIVIENCSSGGHRLEPSFLGLTQLSSFSDAHEEREIPVIAANLHRAMPPRQSLIWAVLRKEDTEKRLIWSLCATLLGVMCLSGDVYDLSREQWAVVDEAIAFYRRVAPVIQEGTSIRHGPKVASYRHAKGWQAVERTAPGGREKLIVLHVFDEAEADIRLPLAGGYRISARLQDPACKAALEGDTLTVSLANGACALYLIRT